MKIREVKKTNLLILALLFSVSIVYADLFTGEIANSHHSEINPEECAHINFGTSSTLPYSFHTKFGDDPCVPHQHNLRGKISELNMNNRVTFVYPESPHSTINAKILQRNQRGSVQFRTIFPTQQLLAEEYNPRRFDDTSLPLQQDHTTVLIPSNLELGLELTYCPGQESVCKELILPQEPGLFEDGTGILIEKDKVTINSEEYEYTREKDRQDWYSQSPSTLEESKCIDSKHGCLVRHYTFSDSREYTDFRGESVGDLQDHNVRGVVGDGLKINKDSCFVLPGYQHGTFGTEFSYLLWLRDDEERPDDNYTNDQPVYRWSTIKPEDPDEANGRWQIHELNMRTDRNDAYYLGYLIAPGPRGGFGAGFHDSDPSKIDVTNWHHYAITHNKTTIQVYFDGKKSVFSSTGYSTHEEFPEGSVLIGCLPKWGDRAFSGDIDELRIYNTALTEIQVQEIYKQEREHLHIEEDYIEQTVNVERDMTIPLLDETIDKTSEETRIISHELVTTIFITNIEGVVIDIDDTVECTTKDKRWWEFWRPKGNTCTIHKVPTGDHKITARKNGFASKTWDGEITKRSRFTFNLKRELCTQLVDNGNGEDRYDIVFVPSHFDQEELDDNWHDIVLENYNDMVERDPFNEFSDAFNVYAVNLDKVDEIGCAVKEEGQAKGYWLCDYAQTRAAAENSCADKINVEHLETSVAIVDTTIRTGLRFGVPCMVSRDMIVKAKNAPHVFTHEFGHSLGLQDEYIYPGNLEFDNQRPLCANCDLDTQCSKWDHITDECIEGCGFIDTHRSSHDSMMNNDGPHAIFNEVSQAQIRNALGDFR